MCFLEKNLTLKKKSLVEVVIKLKIFSMQSQVQEETRPPFSKPSMTHSE